jgi:hypothetical protein
MRLTQGGRAVGSAADLQGEAGGAAVVVHGHTLFTL